jgi:hypothetical protein
VVAAAQKSWEVFHIVVAQGYHGKDPEVLQAWRDLLGERALVLPDSHGVCQLIATTIGVCERSVDLARARTDLTAMGVAAGTIDAVTAALTPVVSALGAVSPVPASGSLPGGGTGGGTDFL